MNPGMEFRRGNDDSVTEAVEFVGNRVVVEAIFGISLLERERERERCRSEKGW